ncbi:MAG: YvcK family protein [Armatimonadetes bacterium]|nr:YvcK family protein [Armatimonadota bacterium]
MKLFKWFYPGMKIKRWLLFSSLGLILFSLGINLLINIKIPILIELKILELINNLTPIKISFKIIDLALIILGITLIIIGIRQWFYSIYNAVIPYKNKKLVEIIYEKRQLEQKLKFVAIGGGTGLSNLLRGLKLHSSNIVAVVTVSDDGGSSGRLRKELGLLPPGDIRNCLVALADEESLMSELFQYRFSNGKSLEGHNFGNLFLAAMTNISGDFDKAIKHSSKILAIRGKVYPITLNNTLLCAEFHNGELVQGESNISKSKIPIKKIFLKPSDCEVYPSVLQAIKDADIIILGPGSLYTSVICNLLVPGVVKCINNSKALKIYICNIMTQPGETDHLTSASSHIKAILDHTGLKIFDYILVNKEVPYKLLEKYQTSGAHLIKVDLEEIRKLGIIPITAELISEENTVRHNPRKLANALMNFILTLRRTSRRNVGAYK